MWKLKIKCKEEIKIKTIHNLEFLKNNLLFEEYLLNSDNLEWNKDNQSKISTSARCDNSKKINENIKNTQPHRYMNNFMNLLKQMNIIKNWYIECKKIQRIENCLSNSGK